MSSDSASFHIQSLTIRRLLGLGTGFTLDQLSPGINIIHGPNGIGKSRTAHALNIALWPETDASGRAELSARVAIGTQNWAIEIDGKSVGRQADGQAAAAPLMSPIEMRDRYNLALQDLLFDHGDQFASAIARECSGGFDLPAAIEAAELNQKPSARPRALADALKQATQAVRDRVNKLQAIAKREEQLADMLRRRESAQRQHQQAPAMRLAIERHDAVQKSADVRRQLDALPQGVKRLTGREVEQIRQIRADIAAAGEAIAAIQRRQGTENDNLRGAGFAAAPPGDEQLSMLSLASRRFNDVGNLAINLKAEVEAAAVRGAKLASAIGSPTLNEGLAAVDSVAVGELAASLRRSDRARAELDAAEAACKLLSERLHNADLEPSQIGPGLSRVEQGEHLLRQWLLATASKSAVNIGRIRVLVVGASAFLSIAGLVIGLLWHGSGFVVAAGGPILFFLSQNLLARLAVDDRADLRNQFEKQFASLGLDLPQWVEPDVREKLTALGNRAAGLRQAQVQVERLAELTPKVADARAVQEESGSSFSALAAQMGLPPLTDEATVFFVAETLAHWRQADADYSAAVKKVSVIQDEAASLLSEVRTILAQYSIALDDERGIDAACQNLLRRAEQYRAATVALTSLNEQLATEQARLADLLARLDRQYSDVGLAPGDDESLKRWNELRPSYERARDALNISQANVTRLDSALGEGMPLPTLSREELIAELEKCETAGRDAEALHGQITSIGLEVAAAKQSSDLEDAQTRQREAAANLAASRAADLETLAGWALAQHLRSVSKRRRESVVLAQASDIFKRITRGRYTLDFDDAAEAPSFRVIDSTSGLGYSLDELSSGTRVQLLLSVRAAFVGKQELGPRLPLFLDETLANSDDMRAAQILDAIVEIARQGRQVFYFTAQPDEVQKWTHTLELQQQSGGPQFRIIDLAALRGAAEREQIPNRAGVQLALSIVPEPANRTHAEYGELLGVPGIDRYAGGAGGVHLWHLVDDVRALHQLLSLGISTWGQWKSLAEAGAVNIVAKELFQRAQARARLIETMLRLWLVGRGRRLDRQAIIDTGQVTDRFLEDVVDLARQLSGDSRRLVAALEDRAVTGFRQATIDRLRESLQAAGYLDLRQALSSDELRIQTMAAVEGDLIGHALTPQEIDAMAATWFADEPNSSKAEGIGSAAAE